MKIFKQILPIPVCAVLILLCTHAAKAQEEGKRIALIIGNNSYSISPLKNAVNDARLMDKVLRDAGFKTILRENATSTQMEEAAADFAGQLGPDDTALFFYAGHGVQIESENFLVPVDFQAANTVIEAKFKCFRLAQLFDELKKRAKRSIVILDACRNNPVAQTHALQAGLAQPQIAGTETFIAFSTSPGQVAADNPSGRDSWFTEALADLIEQPGLSLDEVFTRTKARVKNETEGRQQPWTQSSLTTTFYFHPPSNLTAANDPALAERWMLEAQRREQQQEWSQAIRLLQQTLERKPGGNLEAAAKAKLAYLTARQQAQQQYDAGHYPEAAAAYEKALALDPFAIDAAFQAVDSYLLADNMQEAVRLLSFARGRGTTASVEKANAMLEELGAVFPDASQVVKAQIPPPPSITELFKDVDFATPDWDAGVRFVDSTPVQLARWSKAIEAAYPPPAEPTTASADSQQNAQLADDVFHVEVNASGEARDLSIRKVGANEAEATGALIILGAPAEAHVVSGGSVAAEQLPATLKLAPGKYEIRTVEKGHVIWSQPVQIEAYKTVTVTVEGKQ
jgi:tetratricopeptide (TPR) repeat protein